MGSKKTVTDNTPWVPAQPYILNSMKQTQNTYDANQPTLQKDATMEQASYGRLAPGAEAGVTGAQGLVNDTLGGKYLSGNPYLTGMLNTTNRNITDSVNGQFETGGRYGSGMASGVLAKQIGDADNSLQYQNYAAERQNQIGAIGQAGQLENGAQGLLNNSADLPWVGTAALSGGIRQSSNGYGTQTQTTSDPGGIFSSILGAGATLGGAAIKAGAFASDARVKDINGQVGMTPDGLPLYNYTYKDDPSKTPQVGPVAQEVAQVRPDALGPTQPDGTMTVDYSKLGLHDPGTLAQMQAPNVPKIQDNSFGGILGRAINPDTSTLGGSLTMLGHNLLANGSSWTAGIGKGLTDMDSQRIATAQKTKDDELKGLLALTEYRKATKPQYEKVDGKGLIQIPLDGAPSVVVPEGPKEYAPPPALAMLNAMGIDPKSPQGIQLLSRAVPGYQYTQPVMDAQTAKAAAIAQAQGQARAQYRAPPRASTAAPKYAVAANGQTMKWVP